LDECLAEPGLEAVRRPAGVANQAEVEGGNHGPHGFGDRADVLTQLGIAGQTVVCTFTVVGTHDGLLGPFPATGKAFALPLCEMWHFDPRGRVVGGDLYYDQVSLLTQLGLMPQPSGA